MIETISVPRRAARRTRAEITTAADQQAAVVEALRGVKCNDVATRLQRCMTARLARRGDVTAARTWGFRCGKAGCSWCSRQWCHRAWRTCLRWGRGLGQRSLVMVPLPHQPGSLQNAVKKLRRSLRDVRDHEAEANRRWLAVGMGGVVVGDAAWLVVIHPRVDRQGIERVLRRRWFAARVSADLSSALPFEFTTSDLAELALARRGGEETFKVVIGLREGYTPHHDVKNSEDCFAGMPVVV